jgi:5-oxoprolinase (ATP-hydrolysing)
VILGRLLPEYFPKIFGKTERDPLDINATKMAFDVLSQSINVYLKDTIQSQSLTVDEIAYGFIRVANEVDI